MHSLAVDLRLAWRRLSRRPGFALIAVATLALGIGANAALFTAVESALLRALPYHDTSRLVMVWEDSSVIGFPKNTPAPANWDDWRRLNTVFTGIGASQGRSFSYTGGPTPLYLRGRAVTSNVWTILGATPLLGRTFTEAEENRQEKLAVLSYGLWQSQFGGSRSAVGSKMRLNDETYEVVGVMPRGFVFPNSKIEIWTPASFDARTLRRRTSHFLITVARLRPGVTLKQAQDQMDSIGAALRQQYPDKNAHVGVRVTSLRDELAGDRGTALWVLLAAAAFVLLIACANLASLLLARATERVREQAVCAALGSSRWALMRQSMAETILLAVAGGAGGLIVAQFTLRGVELLLPENLSAGGLEINWRVMAFAAALSALTALISGLVPAWRASRTGIQDGLRQAARSSDTRHSRMLRNVLVAGQVALAVVLLAGTGLLLATLNKLTSIDAGLRPDGLLTLSTPLPKSRYPDHDKIAAFERDVIEKVRALPGVVSAGYTSNLPFSTHGNTSGFLIEGQAVTNDQNVQDALLRTVSIDFLPTIGATLAEGRHFDASTDRGDTEPVIIINQTFARRYWPGRSPLGSRIQCPYGGDMKYRRVVGVVNDVRESGYEHEMKFAVYLPIPQAKDVWAEPRDLVVRTSVDPLSLAKPVGGIIAEVDPDQPVRDIRTMESVVDETISGRKLQAGVLAIFGCLALGLAALGLYGSLAYSVSMRRKEIGIRMAVGADRANVVQSVVKDALKSVGPGLVVGVAGAFAATRILMSVVTNAVAPGADLVLATAATLVLASAAATVFPALNAMRLDPNTVLREE
ncbi:MAG: ABC transporter permease [Bryobacteraceae bacterium]|nr:ABC transporter permease [Bryobacteraceae bacterium]